MTTITAFADKLDQMQQGILDRAARIQIFKEDAEARRQALVDGVNACYADVQAALDAELAALRGLIGE